VSADREHSRTHERSFCSSSSFFSDIPEPIWPLGNARAKRVSGTYHGANASTSMWLVRSVYDRPLSLVLVLSFSVPFVQTGDKRRHDGLAMGGAGTVEPDHETFGTTGWMDQDLVVDEKDDRPTKSTTMTVLTTRQWWLLLFLTKNGAKSDCVEEFGTCVMNRDCCGATTTTAGGTLECVAGDWAVTTDSTCLSKRSQLLNGMEQKDKIALIANFYQRVGKIGSKGKSPEEVEQLVTKYERKFAQLVLRLEKKYETSMGEETNTKLSDDEL
jgi:hypothetical protein